MPQLNTSDVVKERLEYLLEKLLDYATDQLPAYDHLRNKLMVRWSDTAAPKLIVETELRFLAELLGQPPEKFKATIKHDLHVLKRFLQILEDNRTKTQGSAHWHFTLQLWHQSTEMNLREFRRVWEHRKQLKSSQSHRPSETPLRESDSVPSAVPPWLQAPSSLAAATLATDAAAATASLPIAEPSGGAVRHNLPAADHTRFVGRQEEVSRLLNLLRADHPAARISVEGGAGIGKTSLVLEVAQHCLQFSSRAKSNPMAFDAIIFTSAQSLHLTPRGILPRLRQQRTLLHLFRAIAHTLGYSEQPGHFEQQLDYTLMLLARQRILLVVDHLETSDTLQDVLAFLYDLPSTVKVVITSCERAMLETVVRLDPLPAATGIQLIEQEAESKAVQLSQAEAQTLYQSTGGIPAAIVYAIGQLANGYLFQDVLPQLTLADSDFCRFYFERSVQPLRQQPAHRLLMALALFPKTATREAIIDTAGLTANTTAGLARLHQLSLVTLRQQRYTMLPLTREYALAELNLYPDRQTVRRRWVDWHLRFVEQYGHSNGREWQEYSQLHQEWENVQAAIEWCIDQEWYEEFNQFWRFVKGYTHLYGYWNERLHWLDWCSNAAQQRSDSLTMAQIWCDRAWTLILIGKPELLAEAETLFSRAWKLREHTDSVFQLELAIEQAILAMRQSKLETARYWLAQSRKQLQRFPLEATLYQRQLIRLDYYEAEISYRGGNYDRAKTGYRQVLQQAQQIQWQQVEIYALNWLADIALELGHLDEVETILQRSLPIAQTQRDKRSIAFHKRSWAQLHQLRGNGAEFRQWAIEAKECFEALGMFTEAQGMQVWLQEAI